MGRFRDALAAPGLGAIAEFKRRSPSAGDICADAEPDLFARAYEDAGAAAMSVLVDERFGGSPDDLRAARAATRLPLLAKGFFRSAGELRALREAGADAVLLLLRDLDDGEAASLMRAAAELGLDTLVEAHDATELERAVRLGADPLGLNARDLSSFRIDRRAQLELVTRAPRERVTVAESAVSSRAQAAAAELAGADAILVGTALMRAPDPGAKLAELISRPLVKVCGLTRQDDVDAAVAAGADLPWEQDDPAHLERARSLPGRLVLAGRLSAENVGDAIAAVRPWAVDASSRLEAAPGIKDHARVHAFVAAARAAAR